MTIIQNAGLHVQALQMKLEAVGIALRDGEESYLVFLTGRKSGSPMVLDLSIQDVEALKQYITELLRNEASRN